MAQFCSLVTPLAATWRWLWLPLWKPPAGASDVWLYLIRPRCHRFEKSPISVARPIRRLAFAIRTGAIGREVGRIAGAIIIRLRNKRLSRFLHKLPAVGLTSDMEERLRVSITLSFNLPILEELLNRMGKSDEAFIFPAVLFRCVEQAPGATADLGWGRHLARLQVVPILGDHVSLTDEPNLRSLCDSFSSVMSDISMKIDEPAV